MDTVVTILISLSQVTGDCSNNPYEFVFLLLAAGMHYTPVSFLVTFQKDGNKSQFIEVPIIQDYNTSMVFRVVLSFINFTNGQAVANHDRERIYLGDDAQVTVHSVSWLGKLSYFRTALYCQNYVWIDSYHYISVKFV